MNMDEQIQQAAALFSAGHYAEAAAAFNAVIGREDVSSDAKAFMCHNIALCHEKNGDFDNAAKSFEIGARWALTTYLRIQHEHAQLLARAGRPERAVELLRRVLHSPDLRPEDCEVIEASAREYEKIARPSADPPASGPRYREVPPAPL